MSTDGRWCYIVLWVAATRRRAVAWDLLKERLVELCPVAAPFGVDASYLAAAGLEDGLHPAAPQVFLLKFCCFDRMGLLHGRGSVSLPPSLGFSLDLSRKNIGNSVYGVTEENLMFPLTMSHQTASQRSGLH